MVDSNKITSSNIVKQPFWNLFNLINNRSNVPDPNDLTGNRKFVYRRIPHDLHKKFPFIVISRTKPEKGNATADLSKNFYSFDFMITVYTKDEDSDGSADPLGADKADIISNDIINTFNPTNQKTLMNYGMHDLTYKIDTDEDKLEGKAVFLTEFNISFNNGLIA